MTPLLFIYLLYFVQYMPIFRVEQVPHTHEMASGIVLKNGSCLPALYPK